MTMLKFKIYIDAKQNYDIDKFYIYTNQDN